MPSVRLWFDPACYWSWRAARWLMAVADQRDLEVDLRPFSLAVLYGEEVNPDWRAMLNTSHEALRVVQALREKNRLADVTRFYMALGSAVHEQGQEMTETTVHQAAHSSGTADMVEAMKDSSWDDEIRSSLETAMASAGPDVGSPILEVPGAPRGIYGPVFAEVPAQQEAGELWDAIARLAQSPVFFELKRGRQ